jgi:DNA-binding transcriptional LysR family regulator
MLNPVHLRSLREVLATGSFAAAAVRLGYTSSAISQQMTALERTVGMPLFERRRRSVRPTAAAHLLLTLTGDVLAELERVTREMREVAAGTRGIIRLGSFPSASSRIVPGALGRFVQEHPDVEVFLEEGEPEELQPSLIVGDLDIALVYCYDPVVHDLPQSIGVVPLAVEQLFVLLPAGRADGVTSTATVADLRDETWICGDEDGLGAQCLLRLCAARGFSPRVSFRSNDYAVIWGLVGAGLGVALVPRLGLGEGPGVRAVPLAADAPRRHVLALHRSLNTNPLLGPMLSCLTTTSSAYIDDILPLA